MTAEPAALSGCACTRVPGIEVRADLRFVVSENYQLVGGADWINTDRFDIQAKAAEADIPLLNAPRAGISNGNRQNGMNQMIQSMLADRFQLRTHRETRELPVFLLTVAKSGLKMQPTVEGRDGPGGLKSGSSRSSQTKATVEISGSGITMTRLANMLAGPAARAILDRTNLTGTYDFTLKFVVDQPAAAPPGATESSTDPSGPSLFTALQEQLGLRLEAGKGPVDTLVIDSVQRPSEN
jgi:uncharacterized protein (TIGR03435 family)